MIRVAQVGHSKHICNIQTYNSYSVKLWLCLVAVHIVLFMKITWQGKQNLAEKSLKVKVTFCWRGNSLFRRWQAKLYFSLDQFSKRELKIFTKFVIFYKLILRVRKSKILSFIFLNPLPFPLKNILGNSFSYQKMKCLERTQRQ